MISLKERWSKSHFTLNVLKKLDYEHLGFVVGHLLYMICKITSLLLTTNWAIPFPIRLRYPWTH